MLFVANASTRCQRCRVDRNATCTYCPRCSRRLCRRCSPTDPVTEVVPIYVCARCRERASGRAQVVQTRRARKLRRRLTLAYQHIDRRSQRVTSLQSVRRGLADYEKYADLLQEEAFPAAPQSVLNYVAYSITCREPRPLDSSTVCTYAQGQSLWHDVVRETTGLPLRNPYKTVEVRRLLRNVAENYKLPSKAKQPWSIRQVRRMFRCGFADTRSGRHRRLCLMVQNCGILRKNAARRLRCDYRVRGDGTVHYGPSSDVWVDREDRRPYIRLKVNADKNVTARKQREAVIPDVVRRLGIRPVAMLEGYLVRERPPSGGYLLAAPLGRTGFRTTPYGNMGKAYQDAYRTAFPQAGDANRFGSGSARKAMSQWLWADGWAKRVIADAGGWFLKKSAVDLYFRTEPKRILAAIRNIGRRQQGRRNRR